MKFLALLTLTLLLNQTSFACGGCSSKKSGNLASNIQSSPGGSPTNALAGAKIIGGVGERKAFKDSKIFDSVGKDQGDVDPNWKSSIE